MASPLANKIDLFLKAHHSPLAGHGNEIVAASKKYYKKNPTLLASLIVGIAGAEQSYGTTGNADVTQYHNLWGYGHPPSGLTSRGMFGSWGQGIDTVAKALSRDYLGQGLTRPETLYGRWVKGDPVSTAKQGGYQAGWIGTVGGALSQFGATPAGDPTVPATAPVTPTVPVTPTTPAAPTLPPPIDFTPFVLSQLGKPNWGLGPLMDFVQQQDALQPPRSAVTPANPKPVAVLTNATGDVVPVVSEVTRPSPKAANAIKLAKEYLGTPYSWGGGGSSGPSYGTGRGAGTKGFDCSGLLQYVWAKQGVTIPRVTYDQWDAGQKIAKNKLQPGDAVFFHMGPKGPEHVGIYLGNNQFLHAPHTGDVVKISTFSTYGGYVGARRYGAASKPLAKPAAKPRSKPAAADPTNAGPPSTGGPWKRTADGWVSMSSDPAWRGTIF